MNVRDVMTTDVMTVPPGESLKDVAKLMVEQRISGVPVVDGDGAVLGVVTEADLLIKSAAFARAAVGRSHGSSTRSRSTRG